MCVCELPPSPLLTPPHPLRLLLQGRSVADPIKPLWRALARLIAHYSTRFAKELDTDPPPPTRHVGSGDNNAVS